MEPIQLPYKDAEHPVDGRVLLFGLVSAHRRGLQSRMPLNSDRVLIVPEEPIDHPPADMDLGYHPTISERFYGPGSRNTEPENFDPKKDKLLSGYI